MADINEIGTEEGSDQLAQSSDQGEPIGEVESTTGTVTVTHADGTQETLEAGSPVYQGDTLETSDDLLHRPARSPLGERVVRPTLRGLQEEWLARLDQITFDDLCAEAHRGGLESDVVRRLHFSI